MEGDHLVVFGPSGDEGKVVWCGEGHVGAEAVALEGGIGVDEGVGGCWREDLELWFAVRGWLR